MTKRYPYTVLYVDDVEELRKTYQKFLSRFFQKVFVADNGEEALHIFYKEQPDIVISDIVMPQLDGLELLRRIREANDRTCAILMTAYSDREKLLVATELNLTKYLIKPVRKESFVEAIHKAVQQLQKHKPSWRRYGNGYTFDPETKILCYHNRPIGLTKNEMLFVALLAEAGQRYQTIEQLEELFYLKYGKEVTQNALKLLIARLKRKLPEPLLQNRFGHGYRLTPTE
ncbi:response regulator transcription factor [Hydrogenimonas sp.]